MEEDPPCTAQFVPPHEPDLDFSFTSIASSLSTATTFASSSSASSARSSLSLPFDPRLSFSATSSLLAPRPHNSSDARWSALRAAAALSPDGSLHLHHLNLLRQVGSGHLARVFHCRLADHPSSPDFALKVVDHDALARANNTPAAAGDRLSHVRTEARVLAALDHPFLPTLYAHLDAPPRYTCFLLDYCPAGDLHSLLHRQPGSRLPLAAARFAAAEVLLALEYLHAAGFVYRDLKPENILRRADGHLVLSDFDLCLPSHALPTLRVVGSPSAKATAENYGDFSCCCFGAARGRRRVDREALLEFVAEPVAASSKECVGTHEYLAPEVASGEYHGAAVDWWAFGVFLYELLYGRTPFKGGSKESTLRNIRTLPLRFPGGAGADAAGYAAARDLITRLLVRDPRRRLGNARGAAELKRHPFFEGVDWPLIRSYEPPSPLAGTGGGRKMSPSIRERRRRREGGCRLWKLWRSAGGERGEDDKRHDDVNGGHKKIDNLTGIGGAKVAVAAAARATKRSSSMNGWFD